MERKAVLGIMLTVLLLSLLSLAFNTQPVKASGTIYIRADGSIDPPTAPIQRDGDLYTLTGNITSDADGIVIERNNIIVDGLGYTLRGTVGANGIDLAGRSNVTIKNFNIEAFDLPYGGIWLDGSSNNSIIENTIVNTGYYGIRVGGLNNVISKNKIISTKYDGIYVQLASKNVISGNTIANSGINGIVIGYSSSNMFYHNTFVNNTLQVYIYDSEVNLWDNGYPSGGNYWSDYAGVDLYSGPYQNVTGSDGIGDSPYTIDADNQDNYPLMNSWFLPWGNWSHYHSYIEIVRVLLYLNDTYPDIVDVFSIGKSWQNRDIYFIRLTNESNIYAKPKVFFVGYHHAREPITAELALYFAVEAATKFGTNATITRMLNYSEIYIVPALNVDGFNAVKRNDWQRKNARPIDEDGDGLFDEDPPDDEDGDGYIEDLFYWDGYTFYFIRWEGLDDDGDGLYNEDWIGGVDLNRNYDYQWQWGSSDPQSEIYKGTAPFSEPETQAIRNLALEHNFTYAISFHSGAELILYPWGYTYAKPPDETKLREIAHDLSTITGGTTYEHSSDLYISYGLWDDWMYGNRSTFAFTCEIYENDSAWQYEPGPDPNTWWESGILQSFNPDPLQIETVIYRWLPVFTYITNRAITEVHNIATTNVTLLKTIVGQDYTMHVNVTVANKGEFTETFNVAVYANATTIESTEVTLTSGASTTITFTWNTTGFANGNYTISAYATPVPGETDTTDNRYVDGFVIVAIIGDVNGDKIVDVFDLIKVGIAFGSKPGDPNWNPNADLREDNIIDVFDLIKVAIHFGEKDP